MWREMWRDMFILVAFLFGNYFNEVNETRKNNSYLLYEKGFIKNCGVGCQEHTKLSVYGKINSIRYDYHFDKFLYENDVSGYDDDILNYDMISMNMNNNTNKNESRAIIIMNSDKQ